MPDDRAHLDRGFPGDGALPGLRGLTDQDRRARGKRGEKRHDRDHRDQRPPGDRIGGDERHVAAQRRRVGADFVGIGIALPSRQTRHENGHGGAREIIRASIENMQSPVAQHQPPRILELVHQCEVVRGDNDRRA